MIKMRMRGTTVDLKRMRRQLERNKSLVVISASEIYSNKGTNKYFRQYMDIGFVQDHEDQQK